MSTTPRILVVSNYSGSLNAIRPEVEIFLSLVQRGLAIWVMTESDSEYAKKLHIAGAHIIDYRPKSKFDTKAIRLIKSCVKKNQINIVHAFNSKAIACSSMALAGASTKLVGYRGYTGNIRWYDPSCYLTFLNPRVDYMVCLAESVREMFLKNGMSKKKAQTIHKGHKPEWYDGIKAADLSEFGIQPGELVFSLVANHRTRMKGMHYVVKACGMLDPSHSFKVLVIGKGLDTPEIRKLIAETNHTDRMVFAGFRNDASALVKACDVSISASLFGEATQKAMIEAMFLGNPVIITDIPGNRGMAEHKKGGIVIPPADEKALAAAMTYMLENRSELETMGAAAKKHIHAFLGHEKTVQEYEAFYRRILAES